MLAFYDILPVIPMLFFKIAAKVPPRAFVNGIAAICSVLLIAIGPSIVTASTLDCYLTSTALSMRVALLNLRIAPMLGR